MNRFEGKVAIVTGGAKGIGAATSARLAAEGAAVYIADVDAEAGEHLAAEIEGEARFVDCDVSRLDHWKALEVKVTAEHGRLDVLVSNAFANLLGRAHELEEADWDRTLDVTLKPTYLGVKTFAEQLTAARGAVVAVSSVHAHLSYPDFTAYAAAKGGLSALIRQLAAAYGPAMRCNSVAPGPILTTHWDGTPGPAREAEADRTIAGRLGEPEEVAAAIAFLASDEAGYITGVELPVDGGFLVKR
ncbi:SDR family oxidoreductase [Glycomyces albus]